MIRLQLYLFFLLFSVTSFAQTESARETNRTPRFELGLNITNTLAGFLSADGDTRGLDQFLFSLKFPNSKKNTAWRFGLNIALDDKITGGQTFFEQKVKTRGARLRAGFEKRQAFSERFWLYYGADLIGVSDYESVRTVDFNFGGASTLKRIGFGGGGGPVLGFQFRLHPRIILSTEAAVYGVFEQIDQDLSFSGSTPERSVDRNATIKGLTPSALWINFVF